MTRSKARIFHVTWIVVTISAVCLIAAKVYLDTQTKPDTSTPVTLAEQSEVGAPDPKTGLDVEDVWQPAETPKGGVPWSVLEETDETTRIDDEGYIISKPLFSETVKKLEGKKIKVAGWMLPIESGTEQSHFLLLGYPPGCPYHFHAMPNQFIEVYASTPFETDESAVHVVSGKLELTGHDESGIFYRMRDAKPD